MSKASRIVLWIILILVIISALIGTFIWGKNAVNKISFSKPRPQALDLQGLSLVDLANIVIGAQAKIIKATISMDIKNDNNFSIPFSNLNVSLSYNNVLIAQTSNMLAQKKVVPANGILTVSDTVNIILSNETAAFLKDKINGNHPELDYVVNLNVFGIPIRSISDKFVW